MSKKIKCYWMAEGRIVISPNGQVMPCCFFEKEIENKSILDYNKYKNELNINNYSLEEIIKHQWFQQLYESWDNKPDPICIKKDVCSKEEGFSNIMRKFYEGRYKKSFDKTF